MIQKDSFIKGYKKKKQWSLNNISEVHARNYNLMPTAVEIFVKQDGKTYFFTLYKEEYQQSFIRRIKELNPNVIAITDRARDFKNFDYQSKWVEGQLSNFEYLMILNTFAGRSYNDINQYPVFPWILKDYSSPQIDFNTKDEKLQEKIFRKLDTPIGAMNPKKRNDAIEKFENWFDPEEPRFHYGSHYSNAGNVINFLIRMEPFTSLNMDLQSGKFDQADRLFSSIQGAWESCYSNRGDFRELTPEFFYLPDFLKNRNKVDFGTTQTNQKIDSVELPQWAHSPEEFILKHREALESEYVSKHLNEWIDLIFGYKQKGEEAEKAINVYRYLSYEGTIDLNKITDRKEQYAKLEQIFHFGQTPSQLFTTKHPQKKIKNNQDKIKFYLLPKPSSEKSNEKQWLSMNMLSRFQKQPIVCLFRDHTHLHLIFKNLELISVPFQPKSLLFDFFKWSELKSKSTIAKLGKLVLNDLYPQNQIAFFQQGTHTPYLIIGGYIDNSFKIIRDGQLLQSIKFHSKQVTAVQCAYIRRIKQCVIAVGSKDCRITLWRLDLQKRHVDESKKDLSEILYGHHNEVTALFIEKTLGVVISTDKDGVVLIFCIASGKLLRSIYPKLAPEEYIKIIKADDNGFIILVTTKDKIMAYSLNGDDLQVTDKYGQRNGLMIKDIAFLDKLKSYLVFLRNI